MVQYKEGGAILKDCRQLLQRYRLAAQPGPHRGVDLRRLWAGLRLQQQLPEPVQVVGVAVLPVAACRQPVGKFGVSLLLFGQPGGKGPIGGWTAEQLLPAGIAQGSKLAVLRVPVQGVETAVAVKDQALLTVDPRQGQQPFHRITKHPGQHQGGCLSDQLGQDAVIHVVDLADTADADLLFRVAFKVAMGPRRHHRGGAVGDDRQCSAGLYRRGSKGQPEECQQLAKGDGSQLIQGVAHADSRTRSTGIGGGLEKQPTDRAPGGRRSGGHAGLDAVQEHPA